MTHASSKKDIHMRMLLRAEDSEKIKGSYTVVRLGHAVDETKKILTQALKELNEEAVELLMSSGDNLQLVPIEAIDNKISELNNEGQL